MSITLLPYVELDWQEQTPYSNAFGDIYYSPLDGKAESEYVFIQQNNLQQRFDNLDTTHFTIAETGFGTGLNFLNAWQLWQQRKNAKPEQKLYFISTELYPVKPDDLVKSLAQWPELTSLSQQLIELYPVNLQGLHCIELADNITLLLWLGDVVEGFTALLENTHPNLQYANSRAVDAWFLDGFSPQQNQGMWQDNVYRLMAKLSKRGTTLATFTAAGFVRRGLQAAGFELEKAKGFAHKREMLTGKFTGLPLATIDTKAHRRHSPYGHFWPIVRNKNKARSVLVIGAGIAGCTTAYTLAKAGLKVTLLDKNSAPMQQASGNPQAVIFPKFSADNTLFAQFNLHSMLYALRFYQQQNLAKAFHPSGLLQLENKTSKKLKDILISNIQSHVNAISASKLGNTKLLEDALQYPSNGWIDTQLLANLFLQTGEFEFIANQEITSLTYHDEQWQAKSTNAFFSADAVILCNAQAANQLLEKHLPTKTIRGQITAFSASDMPQIKTVVCKDKYICPPIDNTYTCGASFDLHNNNPESDLASQEQNLAAIRDFLPEFSEQPLDVLFNRVDFRCTTPDYLPITGPVAKHLVFQENYKNYQHNAKAMIPALGNYHDGLFINIGFGSRGFSSAPIAAAVLRSYLLEQPYCLPFPLISALNPARFLIRTITGAHQY